ncbi:MAG: DUF1501 domain-containing protein, partial [Planctomycetaceae bacterium]|nr:DUF1501 domain-containing protein [Planctomycetaceae bacterium]
DPKPQAPSQIRGEFGSIPTVVPGINIGELMPRTASHVDKLAILRAVVTKDQAHSSSGYQMLTGVPHIPLSQENVTSKAPNLSPSHAAMMRVLRPDSDGLPSSIALPYHIANDGEIIWPGQKAGILGRQYDPWQLYCDPSESDFSVPDLSFPQDIAAGRFDSRRQLLEQLNRYRQQAIAVSGAQGNGLTANMVAQINPENEFEKKSQQAFELLAGNSARKAFRLHEESESVRDRYGRYRFGQSCLLARRLVQAGVSLVQVNWTRVDGKANNGTWDTHRDHCASLKSFLMPMMDQTYSALIEDLHQQGMLEETLVVWISEFGHTPRINGNAGRDHWGNCFSIAMAGGGIQGGVTHGQSDPHAAYPVADIVTPADVTATMFHCLGHSPDTMLQDQTGRPFPLTRGSVIEAIV